MLFDQSACREQQPVSGHLASPEQEGLTRIGRARAHQGERFEGVRNTALFNQKVDRATVCARTGLSYPFEHRGHRARAR